MFLIPRSWQSFLLLTVQQQINHFSSMDKSQHFCITRKSHKTLQ